MREFLVVGAIIRPDEPTRAATQVVLFNQQMPSRRLLVLEAQLVPPPQTVHMGQMFVASITEHPGSDLASVQYAQHVSVSFNHWTIPDTSVGGLPIDSLMHRIASGLVRNGVAREIVVRVLSDVRDDYETALSQDQEEAILGTLDALAGHVAPGNRI